MSDRDDATTRSAAYAAGAMTPEERAEFEALRRSDPAVDAEAAGFTEAAGLLGLAVDPDEPPARLRASILASIDETAPESAPAPVRRIGSSRRFVAPLLAAAASLVLIAGTASVVSLALRPDPSPISSVLAADDAQTATGEIAGGGSATLIWSLAEGASVLLVSELPELSPDQTYQLWYIDSAGAAPAGLFAGADSAQALLLDGTMVAGAAVGVTVEPRGGSPAPTTDPILVIASA